MANQISGASNLYNVGGHENANYGYGNLSPEQALAERSIAQKKQIANLMMTRGMERTQTPGQMVGRFYVPASPWQGAAGLGEILGGVGANYMLDKQSQGIGADAKAQHVAAVTDYMDKMKAAQGGQTVEAAGPGVPMVNPDAPTPANHGLAPAPPPPMMEGPRPTAQTPPDPQAAQMAIREALMSQDPTLQKMGGLDYQAAAQEKEHGIQREFLGKEHAANRDVQLAVANSKIDQMMTLGLINAAQAKQMKDETLKTQLQMNMSTNASHEKVADTAAGARVESAGIAADAKGSGTKNLPASVGGKFMENSQNLRMAERAQGLISGKTVEGVKGDTSATGLKNYLPDAILQRTDPKGVETRAAVANLGSMIIHDRSGAAVTASEYPRLKPFIPTATDDPATVQKKLGQFINEYRKINDEMTQFYTESGYKVPTSDWHQSPLQASPTAPASVVPSGIPPGAKQIGTSKGKPVFQLPDGSKVIAD